MEKMESWALVRWGYAALASISLFLGIVGLFLPLLPTTPFVIVAAWAAARGSPRLHFWLLNHPHIGPLLKAWQTNRAVPRRAKWLACITMGLSWIGLFLMGMHWIVLCVMAAMFVAVSTFLITRPEPEK